jgi:hypothetical protein
MIWMDVKPFSLFGIADAAASRLLYSIELAPFRVSADVDWLREGRKLTVRGQPVIVFNELGILFYTTNQDDFRRLQDAMQAALGVGASAALGASAGALVNLIRNLPQSAANGSELERINNLVQIGTRASQAEQELDSLDVAI